MESHGEWDVIDKSVKEIKLFFASDLFKQSFLKFCYLNPLSPEKVLHFSRGIGIWSNHLNKGFPGDKS